MKLFRLCFTNGRCTDCHVRARRVRVSGYRLRDGASRLQRAAVLRISVHDPVSVRDRRVRHGRRPYSEKREKKTGVTPVF